MKAEAGRCESYEDVGEAVGGNAKSGRPGPILFFLLTVHTALLAYGGHVHSPTLNEPAHLVAGISHWEFGRFDLYQVNPPLVRMVAAMPVLAAGVQTDWSALYQGPGARPAFDLGEKLVAANGERSFWLFTIARWACIPFSLIGVVVCYLWARDLYGVRGGLLAATFWSLSPNILAHASLITADTAGAALGVAACYTFWHWLRRPTWARTFVVGAVLGLAELAKTTLIIFYVLWPVLWLAYRLWGRGRLHPRDWLRQGTMLSVSMLIGIYVLNLSYGFEGSLKPLGEFKLVSSLFSGKAPHVVGNRFAETWLGAVPVPLPEDYLLGIDLQRCDLEDHSRLSYLRGEFRQTGWWYYYLYALGVKVPLGTWGLLLFTVVLRLFRRLPRPARRDEVVLLLPAVAFLVLVSSQTGFNEHMRYVLPVFPFVLVWIGQIANVVVLPRRNVRAAAALLLVWTAASSLWVYPHSLSYFNELVGGPRAGNAHLIHSNIDWGQDLRYLQWWLDKHPEARPLYLAYFAGFDPRHVGMEFSAPPGEIRYPGAINTLAPGCYAVSVTFLRGYPYSAADGKGLRKPYPRDALSGLRRLTPLAHAGYSIYIYRVSAPLP